MSLPWNLPLNDSEIVEWCSMYCRGNPAEYSVTFKQDDEEYTVKVCKECLDEFLAHGLPKG